MKKLFAIMAMALSVLISIPSTANAQAPGGDHPGVGLTFEGLEPLGPDAVYEGWLIIDGAAISSGTFNITPTGHVLPITSPHVAGADRASLFVLTIEPAVDPDPAPASTHVLAGPFVNGTASLTIDHPAALGTDFGSAAGSFIVATPTTATDADALSGVWFLDPTAGPGPSLDIPTLPAGWAYEGWVVIDGVPVSTGRFTEATGADDFGGFSGPQPAPPFPGEDFVTNAPAGLTFPTDLSGYPVVVSVEPSPDDSPAPFALKPLVGQVPQTNAAPGTPYPLSAGPVTITGTATLTSGPLCGGHAVTVDLAAGQTPTAGDDVILGTAASETIVAGAGNDVVCSGGGDDVVFGQAGHDTIWGGLGNDRLRGGAGDDAIYAGAGADNAAGGRGNDHVYGEDGDDPVVRGGTGDDVVHGGAGNDALVAGNGGEDRVYGGAGNDKVTGGPRPDVVMGGDGDDEVKGGGGADRLYGQAGNDVLTGGAQPDMLNGGHGTDSCSGGTTGGGAVESDTATECERVVLIP